jgi:hypothetical protein
MLTEAQIRKAVAGAVASGKKSIELNDGGERGAGRLALLIRPSTGRMTVEWYAVWYREGKRVSTKISGYPTLSLAEARARGSARSSPRRSRPARTLWARTPASARKRRRG